MRVLVAAGSSGGHIFPALATIDALKIPDDQVLLVLPEKARENKIPLGRIQAEYIHSANLTLSLNKKNLTGIYFFLLGAWESFRIVIRFKPDVVIGFGSLCTVALIFFGWLFRRKTIIAEQNVFPGRANRLLAKLVDKVAISFSQTSGYLNVSGEKIILTGNPLRKELVKVDKSKALEYFGFKQGVFTILVTGGSQGSHKLNTVCLEAVSGLRKKYDLELIHISGSADFASLKSKYQAQGITFKLFEFLDQMQFAYSCADLVISRAGATTIAELIKFQVPAVLIPYPFAYAHQLANAQVLAEIKAADLIQEQELSVEKLSGMLDELLGQPEKLNAMRQAYKKIINLDAAPLLAKEILSL